MTITINDTKSTPFQYIFDEDTNLIFGNNLSIDEPTPNAIIDITITVDPTDGILGNFTITDPDNVSFTSDGTNNSITFSGTLAQINTALATLIFSPDEHLNGTEFLTISATSKVQQVDGNGDPIFDTIGTIAPPQNITLNITPINDVPTLNPITITVAEGGEFTFTASTPEGGGQFGLLDPDIGTGQQELQQMIVKIIELPTKGELRLGNQILKENSVFSYDQLATVKYIHDGSDVSVGDTDSFSVTVNDGGGGQSDFDPGVPGDQPTIVTVTLNPVNVEPTVDGSGKVYEGEDWNLNITAGLEDKADTLSGAQATITISNVQINTLSTGIEGQLYLDVNGDGEFNTGDIDLNSGGSFTVNGSAINTELAKIRFKHFGGETDPTEAPQFNITVKDSGGGEVDTNNDPVTKETTSTVVINIIPVNDDPILTKNNDASITEADTIILTNNFLQVTDNDLPPKKQLVYTLQSRPGLGIIQLDVGSGDWKNLGIGDFFTQDDIDNNKVRYVQEVGITAHATDTFDFKVRDSAFTIARTINREGGVRNNPTDSVLATKTFTINITNDPNNTSLVTSPSLPSSDPPIDAKVPFTNNNFSNITIGDRTKEEGNGVLTKEMLNFAFVNSNNSIVPAAQTVYTLLNLPSNGTLQQWDGTAWVNFNVGSTFTQVDIDQGILNQDSQSKGAIRFLHNGTEDFTSTFDYTVSVGGEIRINTTDNLTDAYDPFTLDVIPINDAPVIGQAKSITLKEGATQTILPAEVVLSDVDGDGSDKPNDPIVLLPSDAFKTNTSIVTFKVPTLPTNGVLFIDNNGNNENDGGDTVINQNTFISKDDLNNGKVKFDYDSTFNTNTFTPTLNVTPYDASSNALTTVDILFSPEKFAFKNILQFQVTDLPDYGILFIDDNNNGTFDFTDNNTNGVFDAGDTSTEAVTLNNWYDQSYLSSDKLLYTHNGTENFSDTFKVQGKDNHGATSDISEVKIDIFSVNDKPLVALTPNDDDPSVILPNNSTDTGKNDILTMNEGATGTIDSTLLKAVDPDNNPIQRQYRIVKYDIDGNGNAILGNLNGNVTNGTLFLNGKALGVGSTFTQTDIDNKKLTYKHNGLEVFTDRFYFQVSDGDQTTDVAYFDIVVNPLNDKATLTTATNTFDMGSTSALPITGISVGDVDLVNVADGETDRIRVTIDPKLTQAFNSQNSGDTFDQGQLSLINKTGITFIDPATGLAYANQNDSTIGNGVPLIIEGTLSAINTALSGNNLTYQTNTDLDQTIELNVTVDDRLYDSSGNVIGANGGAFNQGPNGTALNIPDSNEPAPDNTVTRVININVSTVNDPPTVTIPPAQTVNEDTELSLNGISISDLDDFDGDTNQITLRVANGTINISDVVGLTNISGNGTGTVVLTGTFDAINNILRDDNVKYQGNPNFNGSDPLTVIVEDIESVGVNDPDGNIYTVTNTVPITVTPVNDAPVATVPNTQLLNSSSITFSSVNGNAISIDDSNDFNVTNTPDAVNNFRVTLTVTKSGNPDGTLALNNPDSSLVITGDNPSTITIEGTKELINATLNGLVYTPTDPNSDQSATLNVLVEDLGNGGTLISGNGGNLTDQEDIIINVSDTNDRPSFDQLDGTSVNTYTENGSAILIDNDAILKDNELELFNNWRGSVLTIQRGTVDLNNDGTFTPNAEDIFGRSGTLNFTGSNVVVNGITIGTFTNTGGVLSIQFNNNATTARVNSALQQITYANSSEKPPTSVSLVYTINDGNSINDDPISSGSQGNGGALSVNQAITVNITPLPDAPVVTTSSGNATFTEAAGETGNNNTPILVDNAITITDADDTQMASATISISNGLRTGDVLAVHTTGTSITASYDGNGTLTLSGQDTRANYEAVLQSLTFVNTGDNPTNATRTITYSVTDANSDGFTTAVFGTDIRNITVIPVNDAPILNATGFPADNPNTYVENKTVTEFSSVFSDTSIDTIEAGQNINRVRFTVSGLTDGSNEQLSINGTTLTLQNVTNFVLGNSFTANVSLSGTTATVTINRNTNVTNYQNLINSIGYKNTSEDPTGGDRTFTITNIRDNGGTANSGINNSNPGIVSVVNVIPVNDEPILNANSLNPTYNEDATAVNLFSDTTSSTIENGQELDKLQLTVSNVSDGADEILNIGGSVVTLTDGNSVNTANGYTVTVAVDGGGLASLTITKTAGGGVTPADINTLVNGITYQNNSQSPTEGTRTVTITTLRDTGPNNTFTVDDVTYTNDNFNDNVNRVSTIIVNPVNDAPVSENNTVTINEDNDYVFKATDFPFTDIESNNLKAIIIKSLPSNGTLLNNGNPISIDSTISIADINSGNLVFRPTSDYNRIGLSNTNFTFKVQDDGGIANSGSDTAINANTMTINVNPVNDRPVAKDVILSDGKYTGVGTPPYYTLSNLFNVSNGNFNDSKDQVTGGSTSNGLLGIAIVGNNANATTEGNWQYLAGRTWTNITGVNDTTALVLAPTTRIRFLPKSGFTGIPGALDVRVIDNNSANGTAFGTFINGQKYDLNTKSSASLTPVSAISDKVIINTDSTDPTKINTPPVINELDGKLFSTTPSTSGNVTEKVINTELNPLGSPQANIFDQELLKLGGKLTVSLADSTFYFGGDTTGESLGISSSIISGTNIVIGGQTIGNFTGGTNGTPLVITFTQELSQAEANTLIKNITYNVNEHQGLRKLSFIANDSELDSNLAEVNINVSKNPWIPGNNMIGDISGQPSSDTIIGTPQNDYINGKGANDALYGREGNDLIISESGTSILDGDVGNDTLIGSSDNDQMRGGTGDDLFIGNGGNDKITAGGGNDTLVGGPGADTLRGDTGKDYFVYPSSKDSLFNLTKPKLKTYDYITDFNSSQRDKIVTQNAITDVINGGTISNLNEVINKLSELGQNQAAVLTLTGSPIQHFLVINQSETGFDANNDTFIRINTNSLTTNDFITLASSGLV